jgi:hypothetical protein
VEEIETLNFGGDGSWFGFENFGVLIFLCDPHSLRICCTGMALKAVQESLIDPRNVFSTWDITLVTPCTWTNIVCDSQNHVINL